MKKEFTLVIDNERELQLQLGYYEEMNNRHAARLTVLKKEIAQLETDQQYYGQMITRINAHLAPTPYTANETNLISANPPKPPVRDTTANLFASPALKEKMTAEPEILFEQQRLTSNTPTPKPQTVREEDAYSPSATKAWKSEYALKKLNRPSSTREILTVLMNRDEELLTRDNTTFDKYQKALSATLLQKAAAKNTFYSIKENDAVRYGLIKWERK